MAGGAMADTTAQTQQQVAAPAQQSADRPPEVAVAERQVVDARRAVEDQLAVLGKSTRAALDFPAKIRRNPVRTAGVVGGAAFLVLGGPRRVVRRVEKRYFPQRANRPKSLLPKDMHKTLDRLPEENRALIEGHLERDFAAYLQKEHAPDPANARSSFWKAFDTFMGIAGAAATREFVRRALEIPEDENAAKPK
jgi:hypothetical protein